jgi:Tol biopolymer transport system component
MKPIAALYYIVMVVIIIVSAIPAAAQWSEPQVVPGINFSRTDYYPSLTADGTKLYFATTRSNNEDIYVSERINGNWTTPVNLGTPVNSEHIDFCPSISFDGNILYFSSYNRTGGYGDYDIWFSEWQDSSQSWGNPINAGPNINTFSPEISPSLSGNGFRLYFSSGYPFRPGHVGSLDLYVSEWDGNGWGSAYNLGEEVNSNGIDYGPSIASDDTTIYFASHHHHYLPCWHGPAIDIFVAYYTNGEWTNVENICDPINTNAWERSPFISFDGDTLYFASRRDSLEYDDIFFSVKEPTGIRDHDEYLKDIYDITGRIVVMFQTDNPSISWDCTDSEGASLGSGIYFARIVYESNSVTKKLLFLK